MITSAAWTLGAWYERCITEVKSSVNRPVIREAFATWYAHRKGEKMARAKDLKVIVKEERTLKHYDGLPLYHNARTQELHRPLSEREDPQRKPRYTDTDINCAVMSIMRAENLSNQIEEILQSQTRCPFSTADALGEYSQPDVGYDDQSGSEFELSPAEHRAWLAKQSKE